MNRYFEDKLKTTALRDVLISNTCVVDTGIILQFCIWSIWPIAKIVIVIIKVKAQFFPLLNVYYCQTVPHQPMGAATSKEIPMSGRKSYQCVLPGCWQKPFDPICTTLNYQQRGATQSLGRIFLEQSLSRWLLEQIFMLSCAEVASLKRITEVVCLAVISSLCIVFFSDHYTILHWLKTNLCIIKLNTSVSLVLQNWSRIASPLHCVFTSCLLPGYSYGWFCISQADLLWICWLLLKLGHTSTWLRCLFLFS